MANNTIVNGTVLNSTLTPSFDACAGACTRTSHCNLFNW